MRHAKSRVVGLTVLLTCVGPALAGPTPPVEACASSPGVLGLSRVVEVDSAGGPLFGRTPRGEFEFLAEGEVVLTFDDGPSRPHTRAVLKALDDHCTKATFFMVGRMAAADPQMVREVARRGHTIGAHTWSHAKLQALPLDKAKAEIEMGFSAVANALQGPVAPFFRFPYLRDTDASVRYLKSRQIASFGIDVDSRDFKTRNGAAVLATVLAQLDKRRKGILLFHDIQPSTANAIGGILDALKARGLKVVHLVAKTPATTLKAYDKRADSEISRRKVASAKNPLASRSVVRHADKSEAEVLPWARGKRDAESLRKSEDVPWYKKLLP